MIYVILMTFFLKGDTALTTSITAPAAKSLLECQMFETLLVKDQMKMYQEKYPDLHVVWIDTRCIKIEKKSI